MTSAIASDSESDNVRPREALRSASTPCSDNLGPADGPGTAGWDIATTADHLGINAYTLRHYEWVGLARVDRNALGHRRYDTAAMRRLVFFTRTRALGMLIHDLRRYIELVEAGRDTVPEHLALLIEHREGLRTRIDELRLALVATEYKIVGYACELEGQVIPDNINTPNTSISSTDKEIPS